MKEKIKYIVNKKTFHICMLIVIVVIILFTLGMIVLRYSVEGETNMPFVLSKVVIISSVEGSDKETGESKWAFDVSQNNDIYFYIQKNPNYSKEEAIKSILINNIQVNKTNEKGIINFYRPNTTASGGNFKDNEEDKIQEIEYTGSLESNFKTLKISNQGGIVMFRYANDNIAQYISNDEEINHSELLKKCNITDNDLKAKISMNLKIIIESGKEYKANITFDMPIEGIIEEGTASQEITNTSNIIFKRIKN